MLRQIAGIEKQEEDSLAQSKQFDSMSKDIMELQFKRSGIEQSANATLVEQKRKIQERIDEAELQFRQAMNNSSMAEMDKQRLQEAIDRKKEHKASLLEEYTNTSQRVFPQYVALPKFESDSFVCPTCGQDLPEAVKIQKQEQYEVNSHNHHKKYENDKMEWEQQRKDLLTSISEKGRTLKTEIEKLESEELPTIEKRIKFANEQKVSANGMKNKALEELSTLPVHMDLSDNQEYEALCQEILKKEEALRSVNTGADYRSTLRLQKSELQAELDLVKREDFQNG
ncbi:hypothetical protein [Lacrimispora xylanisolvens]|uniref:hypothetical protein n=1 Tax=Lacrimispora xylanisolvens TaxID=384636 RepID=UPI0024027261